MEKMVARKVRSLKFYIDKFGIEEGNKKFLYKEDERIVRNNRIRAGTSIKKSKYTELDIISGDAIKCNECNKIMCRLSYKHFKYTCTGNIQTLNEYVLKYPNSLITAPNLRKNLAITKEKLIKLWGEDIGKIKWDEYRNKQANSNTFEYKKEKYGWTKEQFDEYNKSRSVTITNSIKRHGEEKGIEVWNNYIDRQRYTCSIEYFISKWGESAGALRFNRWMGNWVLSDGRIVSKEETELWNILDKQIFGSERSKTLIEGRRFTFDYINFNEKKIIEFNGTYWHMDPRKYKATDINSKTGVAAKDCWEYDKYKIELSSLLGFKTYVVWEDDWIKDKDRTIEDILEWWKK